MWVEFWHTLLKLFIAYSVFLAFFFLVISKTKWGKNKQQEDTWDSTSQSQQKQDSSS